MDIKRQAGTCVVLRQVRDHVRAVTSSFGMPPSIRSSRTMENRSGRILFIVHD